MEVLRLKAGAGIILTASHNPIEWNALKFLNGEGIFLNEAEVAELFKRVDEHWCQWKAHDGLGGLSHESGADEAHVDAVLALDCIDADLIREAQFRVGFDGVNGAGYRVVPMLLEKLGCHIETIGVEPSGHFNRGPEPTPENLKDLGELVRSTKCDVGFATDPDADRCALVDASGQPLGEEYTLALATDLILAHTPGPVTVNLSTSRMIEDIATSHGCTCDRAKVGEVNVSMAMKANGSVVGGEGNGGVILPALHYGRDGILAVAMILQLMAERKRSLADLAAAIPAYYMEKRKVPAAGADLSGLYTRLKKRFPDAETDTRDGLRLAWKRSWLHVRPSNTEPIVRAMAEAPTREESEKLCQAVAECLAA
jgi:phosphomannomutase